ncbi:hypothetical protein BN435_1095 [Erwinia amylovora 01SFR-BO]|nr:hypothetical protein BN435_1095 [Erwinia amylovora 01SFR-BO]
MPDSLAPGGNDAALKQKQKDMEKLPGASLQKQ